jgi:predicted double-glycine peptidase
MSLKRILAALVIVLSLESVSSGAEPRRPVRSLLEQRHERVVIQDWDLSCGAAALATILKYQHDDPVSEREVALAMIGREEYIANPGLVRYRHGFSLLDLKRYVDARGYRGVGYGGMNLGDLDAKQPIMVPIMQFGYKHFVVFRGTRGNRVLLADPAWGTRTMTIDRFESAWLKYAGIGRVGFAVERRDGAAPPNELSPRMDEFPMLR